jgi:hypothetical protein
MDSVSERPVPDSAVQMPGANHLHASGTGQAGEGWKTAGQRGHQAVDHRRRSRHNWARIPQIYALSNRVVEELTFCSGMAVLPAFSDATGRARTRSLPPRILEISR